MLELKNITKKYGEKVALSDVSMRLTEGVYGLLGPNGAGKSTLMNVITENLKPDGGEVFWDGRNINKWKKEYRSILGYAPQQQGLYDTFTGKRFLNYMGTLKEIPKKEMRNEIERVAGYVNLMQVLDKPIRTYSGGMKQRLLIAQSIMGNPKLLIMDEPTAGLDPKERIRIREKIKELSEGKIIVIATHVVSDIESIAKEIVILKKGDLIAKAPVSELCKRYGDVNGLEDVYMHIFQDEVEND
ncbi:MAG: ATP-binding cassette domain-containing protein [Lachnospiraceae bacterium]|nr:ATP-binding cassette domain-containing protein [Lachnospiraceae bacterium]